MKKLDDYLKLNKKNGCFYRVYDSDNDIVACGYNINYSELLSKIVIKVERRMNYINIYLAY